jgi:uncharacterized protein involved in outer membrane biogenesis
VSVRKAKTHRASAVGALPRTAIVRPSLAAWGAFLSPKRIAVIFLGLFGTAALIVLFAIALVATVGLRPLVEKYATWTLGHRLTIGRLYVTWGNPLSVQISDLRLANAPWGSVPDMARVESLSAQIQLRSLLSGAMRFDRLDVVKPEIVLERDSDGVGNWRFNGAAPASPRNVAVIPNKRTRTPTFIDFHLHGGSVTYRTSSGAILRNDLHELTIRSAGEDQPVSLTLDGAYNGTPVRLNIKTQSFSVLRNGVTPFGVEFSASTPTAKAGFKGTMMEPLDFEGVRGTMQIDARVLGDFLNIFGADAGADFPLLLTGAFTRTGDRWQLTDAKGKLANDSFDGSLALTEAGRGKSDNIGVAASFGRLDLSPILAAYGNGKTAAHHDSPSSGFGAISLRIEPKRGTNFDAQIKARELVFRSMHFADFGIQSRLASGEDTVSKLTFALAGGTLDVSGSAQSTSLGSHVVANATVSGVDASRLAGMLGAEPGQISGKINGRAALEMTGETVKEALKRSSGHAVLAMSQGQIARALLEKLSTDLRSLFRKDLSSAQISCLIGVIDLRDGLGTISPFRLQTPATVLIGGGQVDFAGERLDMTIKSEAASTGIFAMDIPLHVSGGFANLSVVPAMGSSAGWLDATARNNPAHELPPGLQQLADSNPCPR